MQSRADFRDIILPEILGLLYIVSGNATITFEKLCEQCSKKLEKMGQWKDAEEAGKAPCLPHPGRLRSAPFCPSLYEVAPKRWEVQQRNRQWRRSPRPLVLPQTRSGQRKLDRELPPHPKPLTLTCRGLPHGWPWGSETAHNCAGKLPSLVWVGAVCFSSCRVKKEKNGLQNSSIYLCCIKRLQLFCPGDATTGLVSMYGWPRQDTFSSATVPSILSAEVPHWKCF